MYHDSIKFFNAQARNWDNFLTENDRIKASEVLLRSSISKQHRVLDVAAGTGILIRELQDLGISAVKSIDISPEMVKVCRRNFPEIPDSNMICGNFDSYRFTENEFDRVFIFNAFPHFKDYSLVFENAYRWLKPAGRLIIAHSMTREELNDIHRKAGEAVKEDILISDQNMRELYHSAGFKTPFVSNKEYFFSFGVKS